MCIFIDQKSSKGDENGKHGNRLVYGPAAYKKTKELIKYLHLLHICYKKD